jgi:hypothetical protein
VIGGDRGGAAKNAKHSSNDGMAWGVALHGRRPKQRIGCFVMSGAIYA